jgi:hypothetical protein
VYSGYCEKNYITAKSLSFRIGGFIGKGVQGILYQKMSMGEDLA